MILSKPARRTAKIVSIIVTLLIVLTGIGVKSDGSLYFSIQQLFVPYWIIPLIILITYLAVSIILDWIQKRGKAR
jgi:hypothetical protein